MSLFPKEMQTTAPERMAFTRERGTRKLLLGFVALIVIWYIAGQIWDRVLLSKQWGELQPDLGGLTVVGTLDGRGAYDRNMFRILQANQTSRPELTDYGWRTIFDDSDQKFFSDTTGQTIRSAIEVDGQTGFAMLEPFLRVGVARFQKKPLPAVSDETMITVQEKQGDTEVEKQVNLGELLEKFSERGGPSQRERDTAEGMGGGGREVDHGLAIPADTLARVCPIVLTSAHFTEGELEEHPPSILQGRTYTVHLWLTPEGRSRFYQWSREHENESLVFVLNHSIATAARIGQTLDVNDWKIGPLRDKEAGQALVDYVNKHAQRK